MEYPKKEYYFVSNLTDSHEYEYIKHIGEFLVEFLNADLDGYQEGLKCLRALVYESEITNPIYAVIPFVNFITIVNEILKSLSKFIR